METVMKHFSISERKEREIEEIAHREGRQEYDIVREALSHYLRSRETSPRTHASVRDDSIVRPGDEVMEIDLRETWPSTDDPDDGDVVRAIEPGRGYVTYYKFIWLNGSWECQTVVPFDHSLIDEISRRSEKYR